MTKKSEIALLIPHFNQLHRLEKSLETINFSENLLVIIVDDGSDAEQKPVENWRRSMEARIGFRVHLISHDKNEGIEVALNSGLSYIFTSLDAKYIARLDCGDYNVQNRFDRQYEFMEANTDVCLVGSWADVSENNRPLYTIRTPSTHHEIQKRMLINNCFIHPTVMFRTAAAREVGLYPRGFPAAEDYAYFFLFVKRFITANIPEVLVHLPKYDEGISRKRRKTQLISRIRINLHNFRLDWNSVRGLLTNSFLLVVPIGIIEYLKMAHDRASHH